MIKKLIAKSFNTLGYELKKKGNFDISLNVDFENEYLNSIGTDIVKPREDAKIYVFFHKKHNLINSEYYHNGGLGGFHEGMDSHDAENADNISCRNKHYCELTGIYHIWRASVKPSILGTAHYRRYLNVLPLSGNSSGFLNVNWSQGFSILNHPAQKNQVIKLLNNYDIIVPKAYFLNEGWAEH